MIRTLTRGALAAVVIAAGLGPPARAGSDAELRARIAAFVRDRSSSPSARIQIPPLDDFVGATLPPGRAEVRLQVSPRERMTGSVPITLVQLVDGREVRRGAVTVHVETQERVLVAARDLPRGTRVTPSDVARRAISGARVPRGALSDPDGVVGLRTTRRISAGTVWRPELVRDAPAVSRGQLVPLRLERGPLAIQATGKSRDEGRVGDRIRVLNVDSRREVMGVVGADGVVRVVF